MGEREGGEEGQEEERRERVRPEGAADQDVFVRDGPRGERESCRWDAAAINRESEWDVLVCLLWCREEGRG